MEKKSDYWEVSFLQSILGVSRLEKDILNQVKSDYPKYHPSTSEIEFSKKSCEYRVNQALKGIGMGAGLGLLISATAMRRKRLGAHLALNFMFQNIGYIVSIREAVYKSLDDWVTFDKNAIFNGDTLEYIQLGPEKSEFSFMAEYFRRKRCTLHGGASAIIAPYCKNETELNEIYIAKFDNDY